MTQHIYELKHDELEAARRKRESKAKTALPIPSAPSEDKRVDDDSSVINSAACDCGTDGRSMDDDLMGEEANGANGGNKSDSPSATSIDSRVGRESPQVIVDLSVAGDAEGAAAGGSAVLSADGVATLDGVIDVPAGVLLKVRAATDAGATFGPGEEIEFEGKLYLYDDVAAAFSTEDAVDSSSSSSLAGGRASPGGATTKGAPSNMRKYSERSWKCFAPLVPVTAVYGKPFTDNVPQQFQMDASSGVDEDEQAVKKVKTGNALVGGAKVMRRLNTHGKTVSRREAQKLKRQGNTKVQKSEKWIAESLEVRKRTVDALAKSAAQTEALAGHLAKMAKASTDRLERQAFDSRVSRLEKRISLGMKLGMEDVVATLQAELHALLREG